MPLESEKYNKNVPDAVQILRATTDIETPHSNVGKKRRGKYSCNENLKEMIRLANLLPKNFRFDMMTAIKSGENFTLYWYKTFVGMPGDLRWALLSSKEVDQYRRDKSEEYWLNNDGQALDRLSDMLTDEEITPSEFNKIEKQNPHVIASFLVQRGYYGGDYSNSRQREEEREKKRNRYLFEDDDEDRSDTFADLYTSINGAYMKALERIQQVYDFLDALAKIGALTEQTDLRPQARESNDNSDTFAWSANIRKLVSDSLYQQIHATSVSVNDSGEIRFALSEWGESIQGAKITRLRRCEVCDKFFWAGRNDAYTCSKRHAKSRQMKLLRKNWKESGGKYIRARKKKQVNTTNAKRS